MNTVHKYHRVLLMDLCSEVLHRGTNGGGNNRSSLYNNDDGVPRHDYNNPGYGTGQYPSPLIFRLNKSRSTVLVGGSRWLAFAR